ncbi:SGT1 disease resistance protein homolog1 [Zea mays]|uniref:Protein SGT1 homolog n=1 Tax=Zea mays TaxID=4577 RepID=A0A1D6NI94_MAIZE|nr:SGT1 disease resistance protein homolog1 [Zea mays]
MLPSLACIFGFKHNKCIALMESTKLPEAVADANKAIELDPMMHKAYYRKGAACIKLEEYQTAKAALELGSSYASGDSRFARLLKECDERIAEESSQAPVKNVEATVAATIEDKEDFTNMENTPPVIEPPSKPKYRHDYYNSATEVVLTIFAKGVPADSVVIDFGEQMLSVSIEVPGEEPYHFQPRLFSKIIPEKCKYQVLSTKVEIRLAKAEQVTWTTLDYSGRPKTVPQKISTPGNKSFRTIATHHV